MNLENTRIVSSILRRVFYEEHFDPEVARVVAVHFADEFANLVPGFESVTFVHNSMSFYRVKPEPLDIKDGKERR